MVDSRAKGRTAETSAKNELIKLTGLKWERIPLSGALDAKHGLKGDLYVPKEENKYCVEVKHYKDDHINTKIITGKSPMFFEWWQQTVREAEQVDREPLLLFKHDRSKWFAAFTDLDVRLTLIDTCRVITIFPEEISICLLTDFCKEAEFTL